ncbi:MAG: heat-inducible transcription repressor HrcA [Ruminococcus sp.]|nr:heat-inducible transcription repressor HrcA [Ruminococcus sp.]MBQ9515317.1 heat-inducible transcription repressor HrcA [Ruminococcus sp.]
MELALRKEKILSAVVERYVEEGEPIGSKALMTETGLGVSSATIRNELKALDDDGYLTQPHTSAGRIPTRKGYRYYIDNLMPTVTLPERVREHIEHQIGAGAESPEAVLTKASSVLSHLTGAAAVVTTPSSDEARVHRIRFVATGRHTSMAVLVTSTGMVKSRLFRCEFVLTPQLLSMFDKAVNEQFAGVRLREITKGFLQTAASAMGELTLFIPDVLIAIYEAVQSALETSVFVSGQTNLLFSDGYDFHSARNVMKFLSDTKGISMLLNNSRDSKIYLGEESGHRELTSSAVITSRYELRGENAGAAAVIAPMRIDYKTVSAEVDFAAECVSKTIGELIEH